MGYSFFMKTLIEIFENQFEKLHERTKKFVQEIPDEKLFLKPRELENSFAMFSCGEYILRSAAAIEQTFGGITTRLWDDPFEWTLPEELSTVEKMLEYLAEVDETRRKGFAFFTSDEDLRRELPAPDQLKSIAEILLETIARAEHFQGRAFAVRQMLSADKPTRV
ncbi:MAG: hypothetical protein JWN60_2192 [Acidobacteria bacterium]|nr:hypothetical protein [Acidobacteriota bacterium]